MNYIHLKKDKSMRNTYCLVVSFFLLFVNCEPQNKSNSVQPWEEYLSYEEAGFDANKLDNLTEFIKEKSNTTGLIAVYKGKNF